MTTKIKGVTINWEAALVFLSILGSVYILGGQNSETLTIARHNTAMLQEMKVFVVDYNKEKQLIFQDIATLKTAVKYYHSEQLIPKQ